MYPAGTTLHVISDHDNTSGNRGNHDAKNWAGGGSRTVDEMAFSWISWHDLRALTRINLPTGPPGHPARRRCSSLAYSRYARSSRLELEPAGYQEWEEGMDGDGWMTGTLVSTVMFSEPGSYMLQAFGSDAMLISHATVTITVTE